jgi:hypothetical protein
MFELGLGLSSEILAKMSAEDDLVLSNVDMMLLVV